MRDSTIRSSVTRLASGRLLANLLAALDSGGPCVLQTMCESGGMADAILIERL
jgi:hypothetical protein